MKVFDGIWHDKKLAFMLTIVNHLLERIPRGSFHRRGPENAGKGKVCLCSCRRNTTSPNITNWLFLDPQGEIPYSPSLKKAVLSPKIFLLIQSRLPFEWTVPGCEAAPKGISVGCGVGRTIPIGTSNTGDE